MSAGERLIRIFDLRSGNERHQFKLESRPARLAFHPRKPTLAVYVWDSEQTIRLLDANTGQIEKEWKTPSGIHGFGWHQHDRGKSLA